MKILLKLFGLLFIVSLCFWGINTFFFTANKVLDVAPVRYEEYEEIYQTCEQLSQNICTIQAVPDGDPMFAQFSKQQQLSALRIKLNRWTTDYNGKSRMITRSLWKSNHLPQTLNSNQFNCQ